jgi:uncharacterized protein (TIGR03083 family)
MDEWTMVAAERTALADLGASLTARQWDTDSLCEGWKLRHVFAHVVSGATQDVWAFLPFLVRSGFNINRALLRAAVAEGDAKDPQVLVAELRGHATSRKRPPGTTPAGLLAEVVVHGQDMRRPLGLDPVASVDRVCVALESMVRTGAIFGNKKRIAGLRLVATDIEWSYGDGPQVWGPSEALLLATCGRRVALDDLEGPGLETLRAR